MKRNKIIPNLVTLSRAILCPIISHLFLIGQPVAGFCLFVAACTTDLFDGYLARTLDGMTELGAVLDPLCDKIYCIAFYSVLMFMDLCPAWFLALLIVITLFQWLGFFVLKMPKENALTGIPVPSKLGKYTIALHYFWIGFIFFQLTTNAPLKLEPITLGLLVGYFILAGFQVAVFFRYFTEFRSLLVPDLRIS